MQTKYLIRLDDACPTMDHTKWQRIEKILDGFCIKPMVGVIPQNEDSKLKIDLEDCYFWDLVHKWAGKKWTIAMHGYNHVYSSNEGGINPLWNKSEFAGHPLELQREKINKGITIMRVKGFEPKYFFAPSHTFDENTLIALREETNIRVISDTIAFKPYKFKDFIFIPQQSGHPIKFPFGGLLTICYHPNSMNENSFVEFERFLTEHKNEVLAFDDVDLSTVKGKTFGDRLLSFCYFLRRKNR